MFDTFLRRRGNSRRSPIGAVSVAWLREQERQEHRISDGAEWRYGPIDRPHADHAMMNRRLAGARGRGWPD